jgi:hypothetical protein
MYTELYAADERSSMSRAPPHIDMLCYNLGIPHLKVDPLWVDESDVGEWHINYYFFLRAQGQGRGAYGHHVACTCPKRLNLEPLKSAGAR